MMVFSEKQEMNYSLKLYEAERFRNGCAREAFREPNILIRRTERFLKGIAKERACTVIHSSGFINSFRKKYNEY